MKVTKATKEDLNQIAEQMHKLFLLHDENINIDFLKKYLEPKLEGIFLIKDIGFIRGNKDYILDMFIEEKYRRRGYGKMLVSAFKDWSKGDITVVVNRKDKQAINYWKGFNFNLKYND